MRKLMYRIRRAEIRCTFCGRFHVDREEWANRPHHTHLCEHCDREFEIENHKIASVFGVYYSGMPPTSIAGRARSFVHKLEDALTVLLDRVTRR